MRYLQLAPKSQEGKFSDMLVAQVYAQGSDESHGLGEFPQWMRTRIDMKCFRNVLGLIDHEVFIFQKPDDTGNWIAYQFSLSSFLFLGKFVIDPKEPVSKVLDSVIGDFDKVYDAPTLNVRNAAFFAGATCLHSAVQMLSRVKEFEGEEYERRLRGEFSAGTSSERYRSKLKPSGLIIERQVNNGALTEGSWRAASLQELLTSFRTA